MYSAEYPKRLAQFNSTDKYQRELRLLHRLLNTRPGLKVLDYGCGIGTAMKYLAPYCAIIRGYDVNNFLDKDIPANWVDDGTGKFDRIYFMHAIAHIPNIREVVKDLVRDRLFPGGKIIVITPNKIWLREKNGGVDIKSDDTVVEHFTGSTLHDVFVDTPLKCLIGRFLAGERLYCVAS